MRQIANRLRRPSINAAGARDVTRGKKAVPPATSKTPAWLRQRDVVFLAVVWNALFSAGERRRRNQMPTVGVQREGRRLSSRPRTSTWNQTAYSIRTV